MTYLQRLAPERTSNRLFPRFALVAIVAPGALLLGTPSAQGSLGFVENRGQLDARVRYFVPLGEVTAFFTDDGIVFDLRAPAGTDPGGAVDRAPRATARIMEDRLLHRHAIAMRFLDGSALSFVPSQERTTQLHYFMGDSRNRSGADHSRSGSGWHASGADQSRSGSEWHASGADQSRSGSEWHRSGADQSRSGSEWHRSGADHSRSGSEWHGSDADQSRSGSEWHRSGAHESRSGSEWHRSGAHESRSGSEWHRSGADQSRNGTLHPVSARVYETLTVREIWPGIDLVFSTDGRSLNYETRVAPGADPSRIAMEWEGAHKDDSTPVARVQTTAGTLLVSGDAHGGRIEAISLEGGGAASPLDPADARGSALRWSSFLGGTSDEIGWGLALDTEENVVVTGLTLSVAFPTTVGAYDTSYNQFGDVFVAKLSADGSDLLWGTFLGGTGGTYFDYGYAVVLDDQDQPVIVGYTGSADFPTTAGAYDRSHNGGVDAFVAKFSANGSALLFSTFLGDVDHDIAYSVALDGAGHPVVSGRTLSPAFPTTPGAYDQFPNGEEDGFVAKLRNDGQALLWSTLVGGSLYDGADVVELDSDDRVMVVGYTASFDFPTTAGAHDPDWNGGLYDAFALKLEGDGGDLLWSTYVGGGDTDFGNGLVLDAGDNLVMVGETGSFDFPVTGSAYDDSFNGADDAYVAKLSGANGTILWSTFLGGTVPFYETAFGVDVDASGRVVVCGTTPADDFPTVPGEYDTSHNGGQDVFVSLLASDGSSLLASTFLGAGGTDYAWFARFAENGEVVLTGDTGSVDFPTTPGAFDPSYNGSDQDVWVARLALQGDPSSVPADLVEGLGLIPSPNPAFGVAHFALPESVTGTFTIVDTAGRVVARSHLVNADQFTWTGTNASGAAMPTGMYLAVLEAGQRRSTSRFLLLR